MEGGAGRLHAGDRRAERRDARTSAGRDRASILRSLTMTKTFGFTHDELKLLLVAVRHMRRTFAQAQKAAPEPQPAAEAYARLYDGLFEKLRDMVGPIPDEIDTVLG